MKELYLGVARSVDAAQNRRGNTTKRWSPPSGDQIKALRHRLAMSQSEFANEFGLELNSLKNWEQNRSVPEGASRQIFWMITADPEATRNLVQSAVEKHESVFP